MKQASSYPLLLIPGIGNLYFRVEYSDTQCIEASLAVADCIYTTETTIARR